MRILSTAWSTAIAALLACVAALLATPPAASADTCAGEHWVGAWAGVPSHASTGNDITDLFTPSAEFVFGNIKQPVSNSTVRAILTPSIGGSTVRVRLSNRFGRVPVTFAHTTIGRQAKRAELGGRVPRVTFDGRRSITVSPGRDVVSDPISFSYDAFDNLAVSTYVPGDVGKPTEHYTARQNSYFTATARATTRRTSTATSSSSTTRPARS